MPFVEGAVRTFSKIRDKSCEKIMVSTFKEPRRLHGGAFLRCHDGDGDGNENVTKAKG